MFDEHSIGLSSFLAKKTKEVPIGSTILRAHCFFNNGEFIGSQPSEFVNIGMDAPLDVLPNRSIDESKEPIEDLQDNVEELTMQPHQLKTHAQTLVQT